MNGKLHTPIIESKNRVSSWEDRTGDGNTWPPCSAGSAVGWASCPAGSAPVAGSGRKAWTLDPSSGPVFPRTSVSPPRPPCGGPVTKQPEQENNNVSPRQPGICLNTMILQWSTLLKVLINNTGPPIKKGNARNYALFFNSQGTESAFTVSWTNIRRFWVGEVWSSLSCDSRTCWLTGGSGSVIESYLCQAHSVEFLLQGLHPLEGFLGVQDRDAHHWSLDFGAGNHQDLTQPVDHMRKITTKGQAMTKHQLSSELVT